MGQKAGAVTLIVLTGRREEATWVQHLEPNSCPNCGGDHGCLVEGSLTQQGFSDMDLQQSATCASFYPAVSLNEKIMLKKTMK